MAAFLAAGAPAARAAGPEPLHASYDALLKARVKGGLVDYAGLKADRKPLDLYLSRLAKIAEPEFNGWSRDEQLAFLINLYNATTLRLIVDRYPVKSIKDIGGLLKGPWSQPVVRLFGGERTLNDLEHKLIRPRYKEPRVHFALVCAARGCPPLREEAYVAARLAEQLDDQGRRFLGTPAKNRVEDSTLRLSPIFKWYAGDFAAEKGGVVGVAKRYLPADAASRVPDDARVAYTDYDWSLNDQRAAP